MIDKVREYWNRAKRFLTEVKIESKKVTWPTKQQLTGGTILVIMLLIVIGIYLGAIDLIFSQLFGFLEKKIGR